MNLVRADNVVKRHGRGFRLGPADFRLDAGEVLGVMGPNAAGKTTLLRLLWGFLRPDEGTVWVLDMQPHLQQVSVRLRAGYLAESPGFYGWMTARKHLQFVSRFYDAWDALRSEELMEQFGIDPDTRVDEMSRGTRVKLALVAATSHNPSLLLLDEPTASLDPLIRRDILSFLKGLAKNQGVGIVLSSHISDDLDRIADTVLMLNQGRIMEYAPASVLTSVYGLSRLEEIFIEAIKKDHQSHAGIRP